MCLIIHTETGNIPKEHLHHALATNRDGWGYMFHNGEELVTRKGLHTGQFWSFWKRDKQKRQGKNVLFHARIGTSGLNDLANCHPFKIGNADLWMMHNGIITSMRADKTKSDTRLFVEEILEQLPEQWMYYDAIIELISEYIGNSKLAFMDSTGNVAIINKSLGVVAGGIWYSHTNYKPYHTPYKPYEAKKEIVPVKRESEWDKCEYDTGRKLWIDKATKTKAYTWDEKTSKFVWKDLSELFPTPYVPVKYRLQPAKA